MSETFVEVEKKKPNLIPVGRSGTLVSGSIIDNDYLSELTGIEGQIQFKKMLLGDSTIRKAFHAVSNPIRSAGWDIEPASEEKKDLDVAALIKQAIFCDIPNGFKAKLDEIVMFPWVGHGVFELTHRNVMSKTFGAYTTIANLGYRDPTTLDKWNHDRDGNLVSIHQLQQGDIPVDADMLAENLVIFYNEKKGNDNGYPFCRMLFGNYKRKLLYKQLQAIGIERAAIPVPHLELPEGVDSDSEQYADAVEQLAAFTQAEQAFFVTPAGYKLNYHQTGTFDPSKVQTAIRAENEEIAGSLVAMWLEMGIGGNSAVGASTGISADFFRDGIEYIADKIADTINLEIIPQLVFMNFGDTVEVLPKLTHNGIADEAGKELMEVITGYTKHNVITPDEPLEDHVRKAHNLPKKAEGELIDNGEAQDENNNDDPNDPDNSNNKNDDELELSDKAAKTTKKLIDQQAVHISDDIRKAIDFSSAKYINDVINRYRQLSDSRKQNATNKTKMGGEGKLRKALKKSLAQTALEAIAMAKKEVPTTSIVKLSSKENDIKRIEEKYELSFETFNLNLESTLPTHIQVLIAKQADLITTDTLADLKSRLDFSYSSIETKSSDENIISQSMEESAENFSESNQVVIKGNNSSSLITNESRSSYFFEPEVLEEIHSFTFMNFAPKAKVCVELAGTTFNINDAESLRYSPPLHHNCKSFLRANLKTSKGVEKLEVSTLSPSPEAKKTVTL